MKAKAKSAIKDLLQPAETPGDLIKSFRENFKIKQDDMAYACGISQANLSAIENGRREVGAVLALRFAAFMGVDPSLILYPKGYEAEKEFIAVQKRKTKLAG